MANLVAVQNQEKIITVVLPAALSATTTLTVLTISLKEFDTSVLFSVTGVTTGNSTTFTITPTQNNIDERVYFYTVDITADSIIYRIDAGGYSIENLADYESNITGSESTENFYNKTETNALLGTKLDISAFNTYSGATATLIGTKLLTSTFNTYCNTTAPATYLGIAACACDTKCLGGVLPAGYLTTNGSVSIKTGTTYGIVASDCGKVLEFTATGATSIYLPTGLTAGFQVDITNVGGGNKTFCACTGSNIHSLCSKVILAGVYNMASAYYRCTNNWVIAGNLC
jgi:hypothetical protein